MPYTNPWVGYISRSYQQIKQDLVNKLVVKVPEATDLSETNILIILISFFAGVAEMLNLYIDNMAQEAFVQTARRFSSMVRLVKLIDYRIRAANPASTDITVIAVDAGGLPVATNAAVIVPAFTVFSTLSGINFINIAPVLIPLGSLGTLIPVKQVTVFTGITIGTSDGITPLQEFDLGVNYVHNSIDLFVAGVPWAELNTMSLALATTQAFVVDVREDGHAYVVFGDGTNGAIPAAGSVIASYYETLGATGNVSEYTLTVASPSILLPTTPASTTKIYNQLPASGGLAYENVARIRVSAPLSLRTLDRAVTYQDYKDIARLAPGMGKAAVDFECGKEVDLYIVPEGGGIAQTPLINTVFNWFETRRMVTTIVNVKAAGETRLNISMEVTARFRADILLCQADVQDALLDYGAYENQEINRRIRISDIVARVDNLARVDYLTLTQLGTIPYARGINGNVVQLDWTRQTLPGCITPSEWRLEYDLTNFQFRVFKDYTYMGVAPLNLPWTDPQSTFTFVPHPGAYLNGATWTFKTYPFLKDIDLDDFTIPVTELTDLNVVVFEQLNPPI